MTFIDLQGGGKDFDPLFGRLVSFNVGPEEAGCIPAKKRLVCLESCRWKRILIAGRKYRTNSEQLQEVHINNIL